MTATAASTVWAQVIPEDRWWRNQTALNEGWKRTAAEKRQQQLIEAEKLEARRLRKRGSMGSNIGFCFWHQEWRIELGEKPRTNV